MADLKDKDSCLTDVLESENKKWKSYVDKKITDMKESAHYLSSDEIQRYKKINEEKMKKLNSNGGDNDER